MHWLRLEQHIAHLQIGCQAAIANESVDKYLEGQTWFEELRLRLKWIQLNRCMACVTAKELGWINPE